MSLYHIGRLSQVRKILNSAGLLVDVDPTKNHDQFNCEELFLRLYFDKDEHCEELFVRWKGHNEILWGCRNAETTSLYNKLITRMSLTRKASLTASYDRSCYNMNKSRIDPGFDRGLFCCWPVLLLISFIRGQFFLIMGQKSRIYPHNIWKCNCIAVVCK